MVWIIVHFTLPFFLFQAVNSKMSQPLDSLQEIFEGLEYVNITLLNEHQEKSEQLYLKSKKLSFLIGMYENLRVSIPFKGDTLKQMTKMLGHIEELRHSTMKLLKKENQLFNQIIPDNIEDFHRLSESDRLIQAYTTSLIQLQTLKLTINRWLAEYCLGPKNNDEVEQVLKKLTNDEDIPEISPDDTNYEDPPPPFDDETGNDELEKLQRIALTIKDQLYEMPKLENEDKGDDVKSKKIHSQNIFSEKPPRWLLTEKDIEEIQIKYLKWSMMLENPELAGLKEMAEKSGFNIKFFCKTLAEYFNLTSIVLDCTMTDDTECQEILSDIFSEERFKKFFIIFTAWKDSKFGSY